MSNFSDLITPTGVLTATNTQTVTNKTINLANNTVTGTANININGTVGATTPAAVSATSLTDSGNLNFTGTGNRITGDFSNATAASRVLFQTSTGNNFSSIGAIPNGTGTLAEFSAYAEADTTNSPFASIRATAATDIRFSSTRLGTGTFLPMTFYTGGSERVRVDTAGAVTIPGTLALTGASSTLGYGTGSGGTVTQLTSKATSVTLNKPTGQITMNNAALAAGTTVAFQCANNLVGQRDLVVANIAWGTIDPTNYSIRASAYITAAGTILFQLKNESAVSLSEAVIINFAVIKGSIT